MLWVTNKFRKYSLIWKTFNTKLLTLGFWLLTLGWKVKTPVKWLLQVLTLMKSTYKIGNFVYLHKVTFLYFKLKLSVHLYCSNKTFIAHQTTLPTLDISFKKIPDANIFKTPTSRFQKVLIISKLYMKWFHQNLAFKNLTNCTKFNTLAPEGFATTQTLILLLRTPSQPVTQNMKNYGHLVKNGKKNEQKCHLVKNTKK